LVIEWLTGDVSPATFVRPDRFVFKSQFLCLKSLIYYCKNSLKPGADNSCTKGAPAGGDPPLIFSLDSERSLVVNIRSAKLIYFSPTRTTQKVLEGISSGLPMDSVEFVDLTCMPAGSLKLDEIKSQLAIIGVPVYAGRVPTVAARRLLRLTARNAPAVVVVVYGNREFEDALLELKDLAQKAGFSPIAGGAFIGEHSFSTENQPIAPDRPDRDDMAAARAFGEKIHRKLLQIKELDDLPPLQVPGNRPHRERTHHPPLSPITLKDTCTLCGNCATACPMEAIRVEEMVETDPQRCILCCACVKGCPTQSRVMEAEPVRRIAHWLYTNCRERKTPVTFI
jgi:ferredoxin